MIATAAVIGAVLLEELCHSAGWAGDEAQMHTMYVSTSCVLYRVRVPYF